MSLRLLLQTGNSLVRHFHYFHRVSLISLYSFSLFTIASVTFCPQSMAQETSLADLSVRELGAFVDSEAQKLFLFKGDTNEVIGQVTIPDLSTGQERFGYNLFDVVLTSDGRSAFVADFINHLWKVDVIELLEQGTTEPLRIDLSDQGEDIAISSDNRLLVLSAGNSPASDNPSVGVLSLVDPSVNQEIGTITVPDFTPSTVAISGAVEAGTYAYVGQFFNQQLHQLQFLSSELSSLALSDVIIPLDSNPYNVEFSPDGKYAAVVSVDISSGQEELYTGKLSVLETASGAIISEKFTEFRSAMSLAFSPSGDRIYVRSSRPEGTSPSDGIVQVFAFNPETGVIGNALFNIPASYTPGYFGVEQLAVTRTGDSLFVPNAKFTRIDRFSTQDGSLQGTIVDPDIIEPRGITVITPNTPPTISIDSIDGEVKVPVGGEMVFTNVTFSDNEDSTDLLVVSWDLDGDTIFGESGQAAENGDERGFTPLFSARGIPAGSAHPITVKVTDSLGASTKVTFPVAVGYAPDLIAVGSSIVTNPSPLSANDDGHIIATILNAGLTESAPTTVTLSNYFELLTSRTLPRIPAGQSLEVDFGGFEFPESFLLLTIGVDPDNQVQELIETNNTASKVVEIGDVSIGGGTALINVYATPYVAAPNASIAVGGTAFYDFFEVDGERDFPTQGARVTVRILDPEFGVEQAVFTGTYSTVSGAFSQPIISPGEVGVYPIEIEIFDGTVLGTIQTTLTVQDIPNPAPVFLSVKPVLGGQGGTYIGGASSASGPSIGREATAPRDAFVFSENIVFSRQPMAIGDTISVAAFIQYYGPEDLGSVQVNVNDIFPLQGELFSSQISSSILEFPAAPSSAPTYLVVSTPWTNTANGSHVIHVEIEPSFSQYMENDGATRLIGVGGLDPRVTLQSEIQLVRDNDGDGIIDPGDEIAIRMDLFNGSDSLLENFNLVAQIDRGVFSTISSLEGIENDDFVSFQLDSIPSGASTSRVIQGTLEDYSNFPRALVRFVATTLLIDDEIILGADRSAITIAGDTEAPTSIVRTLDILTAEPISPNVDGFFDSPVTVEIAAADTLSQIESVLYQIDNGEAQEFKGSSIRVTFQESGEHTIHFQSVDRAGNAEDAKIVTIPVLLPTALGDINGDGAVDVTDIDRFTASLVSGEPDPRFDLNNDQVVDRQDRTYLIQNILGTNFGDANFDGVFNSEDLMAVMAAGEYRDRTEGNSTWNTGDWNGDGEFDTEDIILAFQQGWYTGD